MQSFALRALLGSSQKRLFATSISESKITVDYLVNSCGLPKATAISAAQKLDIKEKKLERCGSVVAFFREHGFSDTQLQQLVEKRPELLTVRLDGLRRKMQFLNDKQLSGSSLAELLVSNPVILRRGIENRLWPSLELLLKYLGTIEKVEVALKRSSWLLTCNLKLTMQPNIDLLISEGVSLNAIQLMIAKKPRAALQKPDSMARAIKYVKELGLQPSFPIFIHAVCVRVSLTEASWNGKFDVFRSLGWSDEEIISAFVREPFCLACSEEKIRAVTDFIVKTMKLNQAIIIGYPKLLMYSMESRYKPRFFVLSKLKSKNLVKDGLKWHWVLTRTEKKFVESYVIKHLAQVPDLMKTYTRMRGSKLAQ
uniref:Uncharacterized protein n=1 Tax=Kalanchoe fedtschenkoi TaxID=63787 RepID=A0A7N0T654_KALFE